MSWINTPNGRSIAVLAVVMLASVSLVVGMQVSGLHPILGVRLALALAVVVAGIWAACGYWRNVDEAGRAAQKWAWFWGGSIGMGLGVLAIAIGVVRPEWFDIAAMLPEHATALTGIFYGAMAMVLAQFIGFLVAWAYWWARRR